jgi:hypothetical protein
MVRWFGLATGTVVGLLPSLLGLAVVLVVVIIWAQRFGFFGQEIDLPASSVLIPENAEGRILESFTFTARDGIRPIDDPEFVTAAEADGRREMVPTEFVIGVSIDGESKAYPVNVLSQHEIVNDVVGGAPVTVTF